MGYSTFSPVHCLTLFFSIPVTEDFQRAVKVCTGHTLGPHVVNTVFQIFDSDGDGNLSHQEFISIMKDRLHRGARVSISTLLFSSCERKG